MDQLCNVPIEELYPSPTNPRKTFEDMENLTASVREKGVRQPLLVRHKPSERGIYEIIAGARRYRASLAAGKETVPAIVQDLSDDEVLEIQLIENIQRSDLHPMEEADGYQMMLDRTEYDVPAIAQKVGKSETYVYQRLKLLDLIDPVRKAFLQNLITISHAILIARLQPKDQEEAFNWLFEDDWRGNRDHPERARELAQWIDRQIHLDLKGAPFKLTDESLLSEAGSCIRCPKRTGFTPTLFPDVKKKDTCTDRACFKKKLDAHVRQQLDKAARKKQDLVMVSSNHKTENKDLLGTTKYSQVEKAGECPDTRKAIVAEGYGLGVTKFICTNPDCPVHGKAQISSGDQKWKEEQQKKRAVLKKATLKREAIYRRISDKLNDGLLVNSTDRYSPISVQELRLIALALLHTRDHRSLSYLSQEKVDNIQEIIDQRIRTMDIAEITVTAMKLCLCNYLHFNEWHTDAAGIPELLALAADLYDIDLKKIEEEVAEKSARKPRAGKKPPGTDPEQPAPYPTDADSTNNEEEF
jgi:ParB/RepB/Spo0J family partition protein